MGFLSKLKNSITGGWASVSVSPEVGRRGEALCFTVNISVKSEPITYHEIYAILRCQERVEVRARVRDRDDPGDYDSVNVTERHQLFEQRQTLRSGGELPANASEVIDGAFEIPDHLPSSYRGRYANLEWELFVGIDMKGNDPDSGWVDVEIR